METKNVIIIGGGISGLTTAYRISQAMPGAHVTLLERSSRFGGVIESWDAGRHLMEGGPDSFISEKPWALDLVRELGLEKEIIPTNDVDRRSFILSRGKLVPVSSGFYLMAPTSFAALMRQPLLSWAGKLRMACELFIPPRKTSGDESLASFVRRRFGQETLDKIGQPMIGGIYTADPENLSLQATFPKFLEMERRSGSVCSALFKRAKPTASHKQASGPRYSLFLSFQKGIQTLTNRLIQANSKTEFRASARVESLSKDDKWNVHLQGGETLRADAVCLALPAWESARLLKLLHAGLSDELSQIPYESVGTINMVFRRDAVGHPLNGFGYVVPAVEKKSIVGCTFSSVKYSNRSKTRNEVLMRAFVGGALHRQLMEQSDESVVRTAVCEVRETLSIGEEPVSVDFRRWEKAMPQYCVGHQERVKRIQFTGKQLPGLYLTGNAYEGIGIPDCIRHAALTADAMTAYIQELQEVSS